MRTKTWPLMAFITLMGLFISNNAKATCTAATGIITMPSPVIVKRDIPDGQTLSTGQLITTITCNNTGAAGATSWQVSPSTFNNDYGASPRAGVRQSPYPGIGIRWTNLNSHTGTTVNWSDAPFNSYTTGGQTIALSGTTTFTDTYELVKIGPISSQAISNRAWIYGYRPSTGGTSTEILYNFSASPSTLVVLTCTVTQPTIPVSLGNDIQANSFTGPGSTSADVQFNIPLNCSSNIRVSFQLDGPQTGTPGVLALNGDSGSATGVGVQVLYKGNPVIIGTSVLDTPSTASGPHNIPLTARYYQTGGTVTGGPANATATFTMTFN